MTGECSPKTVVGLVGRDSFEALDTKLEQTDVTVITPPFEEATRTPSVVVTVGRPGLCSYVRSSLDAPVLAVDCGPGIPSLSVQQASDGLRSVLDGTGVERSYSLLSVNAPGIDDARALFDVTLLTAEPARISEFGLSGTGITRSQFRADGVTVATPQGSHGYASAAGGPCLSRDVDALAVVPIAPFVTQTKQWVLPDDQLTLSVEREDDPVALRIDDSVLTSVSAGSSVDIGVSESMSVLVVPEIDTENG